MSSPEVRSVVDVHELSMVYRLRYKVYVEEHDFDFSTANHLLRQVVDDLDDADAVIVGAFEGKELVATARGNLASKSDVWSYMRLYGVEERVRAEPRDYALFSLYAADPGRRGARGSFMVPECLATEMHALGAKTAFFGGYSRLEAFYTAIGGKPIGSVMHPTARQPVTIFELQLPKPGLAERRGVSSANATCA